MSYITNLNPVLEYSKTHTHLSDIIKKLRNSYKELKNDGNLMSNYVKMAPKFNFNIPVKRQLFSLIMSNSKEVSELVNSTYNVSETEQSLVKIFELDAETATILRKLETDLGLAKNTLVKKIPVFEREFLSVVSIYDQASKKHVIVSRCNTTIIIKQNLSAGEIILELVLDGSPHNIGPTNEIIESVNKNPKQRIDLPFGKKVHARD